MNPLPPSWGNWWCWGVEEYDVIYTSGGITAATDKEKWIMMQYVKLFQYSPVDWWNPSYPCPGSVPDLYVGEAIDFDMPSDSGSQDTCGFDQALNLLYQQGYGAGNDVYFAGLCLRDPNAAVQPTAYAGHILRNDEYVYPQSGYADDSLYSVMTKPGFSIYDLPGQRTDYNVVLTADTIAAHSPNPADTNKYVFLVALSNKGLEELKHLVKITMCGNVNRDDRINLGDAIYLAKYVQGQPGFYPWLYMGDVTGTDCKVNLSDVIYLAKYIQGAAGYDLKCYCEQKWP